MKNNIVRKISIIGVMGAISALLYIVIKFPMPFLFPSFLDIQFSEIPAIIISFIYGPFEGIVTLLIRLLIKLPFSKTSFVGELADLLISISLIIPSSLIYKKNKTKKQAVLALCIGIIVSTIISLIVNQYILIPAYLFLFFDNDMKPLITMCKAIKGINENNFMTYYLLFGILPFNLFRYIIVFLVTFLVYKKTHNIIKKFENHK